MECWDLTCLVYILSLLLSALRPVGWPASIVLSLTLGFFCLTVPFRRSNSKLGYSTLGQSPNVNSWELFLQNFNRPYAYENNIKVGKNHGILKKKSLICAACVKNHDGCHNSWIPWTRACWLASKMPFEKFGIRVSYVIHWPCSCHKIADTSELFCCMADLAV